MPDVTTHANRLRGHYSYTGYLSAPEETEVVEGTLLATPSFPTLTASYSVDSGDDADIEEGMEIEVARAGALVGRLRVAAGGATSSVLQINEVSRNRIPMQAGDILRVLRSFRVRDKLVAANATFDKDSRIAYVAQNSLVAPLANDGGHYADVWRDSSVEVPFYGSLSKAIDNTSDDANITHAWTVFGPETHTSTDTDPAFELTQPGTYWVRHVATDENGAAQVKRSVVVLDDNPIPCRITGGIGATLTDPWRTQIRALAGSGIERVPHGQMVLYHEDEWLGGEFGSVGNRIPHRSRVKVIGYINKRSMRYDWESGELVFDIVSPLARLSNLPGFSQALQQVTSPVNWQQYEESLFTNSLLVYLLRWHTTYAELFDVVLPAYELAYPSWFVNAQAPVRQLEEVAQAMDADVRSDRTGTIMIRQNLNLMGASRRDAAATTYHLTDADILEVEEASQEDEYPISQLTGLGFAGDAPLMAISGSPAEGSGFETVDRMIVSRQGGNELALNERVGRHWQFRNKLKDGLPVWRLVLRLRGSYDFFDPAYDEWLLVTLSRTVADYELSITAERFWLESVEIEHSFEADAAGTETPVKYVRVTLWGETDGDPGETQAVTVGNTTPSYDFEEPVVDRPIGILFPGIREIAAFCDDNTVRIARNFYTPAPDYDTVALAVSGTLTDSVPIPSAFINPLRAVIVTTALDGVYTLDDVGGAMTLAQRFTFSHAAVRRWVDASIAAPYVVAISYYGSTSGHTGWWYTYSLDGGTDWAAEAQINAAYSTVLTPFSPGLHVSGRAPGTALTSAQVTTGAWNSGTGDCRLYSLTSMLSVATQISSPADYRPLLIPANAIHVPFHDNVDENIVIFGGYENTGSSSTSNFIRRKNADNTITEVTPSIDGIELRPLTNRGIGTCPLDRQVLIVAGAGSTSTTLRSGVMLSRDSGATWAQLTNGDTTDYNRVWAVDNPNLFFLAGENLSIGMITDGVNIQDKRGNLSGSAEIVNIMGL